MLSPACAWISCTRSSVALCAHVAPLPRCQPLILTTAMRWFSSKLVVPSRRVVRTCVCRCGWGGDVATHLTLTALISLQVLNLYSCESGAFEHVCEMQVALPGGGSVRSVQFLHPWLACMSDNEVQVRVRVVQCRTRALTRYNTQSQRHLYLQHAVSCWLATERHRMSAVPFVGVLNVVRVLVRSCHRSYFWTS